MAFSRGGHRNDVLFLASYAYQFCFLGRAKWTYSTGFEPRHVGFEPLCFINGHTSNIIWGLGKNTSSKQHIIAFTFVNKPIIFNCTN